MTGTRRDAIDDFVGVLGPVAARRTPAGTAGTGARARRRPSATIVLLPVPFMPAMNQVSSIVSSPIGISERPRFAISPRSSFMWMPHAAHCACIEPDAQGHRPVTRQPPSTGTAVPFGASDPATHASGSDSQMSACARSGKSAASQAQTLIRLATQAVEPQPAAELGHHVDVGANVV